MEEGTKVHISRIWYSTGLSEPGNLVVSKGSGSLSGHFGGSIMVQKGYQEFEGGQLTGDQLVQRVERISPVVLD